MKPQLRGYHPGVNSDAMTNVLKTVLGLTVRILFALPDRLLRLIFGEAPSEAAGLRADSWALGRLTALAEADPSTFTPEKGRAETDFLASVVSSPAEGVRTEERILTGDGRELAARLFIPPGDSGTSPLLVHFHGGGWVQGSVESHSGACSWLARGAGVRVLSVEYRLAPEHPFPAQAEDALLAWRAVIADPDRFGADPARIGVSGDSAGGHMATVLCLDLKEAGEPQPACQVLIYPVTDCVGDMESRETFASGFYLTKDRMDWFERCFIDPDQADDPRASPLRAPDLSGLAPAYVSVSIADPLLDEGVAYAARLVESGVPVTVDYMPMLHAWFNVTASRSTRLGHEVLAGRVNELLG